MSLPRKRKKPRRTRTPRCLKQRCKRAAAIAGMCKTHAKKEADSKFGAEVRSSGVCYVKERPWLGPYFECCEGVQCSHLISRRYMNVRWDRRNAVPMCAAHHKWFEEHPLERDQIIRDWFEDYDLLRQIALDNSLDWRQLMLEYLLTPSGAEEDKTK